MNVKLLLKRVAIFLSVVVGAGIAMMLLFSPANSWNLPGVLIAYSVWLALVWGIYWVISGLFEKN
ncbi:MAG TPA: hypothetical protein VMT94_05340 [Burkholderiales bacterium]|nr:hypothetical protein [Burkholderiales bacterium]